LVQVAAKDIIIGNSTSYGFHVLVNGLSWRAGDEVLVEAGEFPATVFPWRGLERLGVDVRSVRPKGSRISADELRREIGPATRLVCLSWVNSFNGSAIDLDRIGSVCRERGVLFVVNGSQAVGARSISLLDTPVDALTTCGFKWLCGPYGTGFCWIRPSVMEQLRPVQHYWLAAQGDRPLDLVGAAEFDRLSEHTTVNYDVFCPANFMNHLPWAAALEYLLSIGIKRIETWDRRLMTRILDELDTSGYRVPAFEAGGSDSTIVAITRVHAEENQAVHSYLEALNFHCALRAGNLRLSPHLYNTEDEIDQLCEALRQFRPSQ
jgi:selenocysteine lyase/cysteine desulfurase